MSSTIVAKGTTLYWDSSDGLMALPSPPTTDEQRMHQDEWLSAIRLADAQGYGSESLYQEPRCVIGRAIAIMETEQRLTFAGQRRHVAEMFGLDAAVLIDIEPRFDYAQVARWLGISLDMVSSLYDKNDGWLEPIRVSPTYEATYETIVYGKRTNTKSFTELADWFKGQRDACDGDLTQWNNER